MKTLLVRPVFVKIDTKDSLISDRNVLTFSDGKIYNPFKNEYYQLILISLDPNEKIDVEDNWIYICPVNGIIYTDGEAITRNFLSNGWFEKLHDRKKYYKVVATQSQQSPDLIQELVDEYNNGGVSDFEIKIHNNLNDPDRLYDFNEPYMPNGFVIVVDKLQMPKIHSDDLPSNIGYVNIPIQDDEVIGKPLEDYIKEMHSQDRCMGFIDGYNARRSEESVKYTEEEVKVLLANLTNDLSHDHLINFKPNYTKDWFENKKK